MKRASEFTKQIIVIRIILLIVLNVELYLYYPDTGVRPALPMKTEKEDIDFELWG